MTVRCKHSLQCLSSVKTWRDVISGTSARRFTAFPYLLLAFYLIKQACGFVTMTVRARHFISCCFRGAVISRKVWEGFFHDARGRWMRNRQPRVLAFKYFRAVPMSALNRSWAHYRPSTGSSLIYSSQHETICELDINQISIGEWYFSLFLAMYRQVSRPL